MSVSPAPPHTIFSLNFYVDPTTSQQLWDHLLVHSRDMRAYNHMGPYGGGVIDQRYPFALKYHLLETTWRLRHPVLVQPASPCGRAGQRQHAWRGLYRGSIRGPAIAADGSDTHDNFSKQGELGTSLGTTDCYGSGMKVGSTWWAGWRLAQIVEFAVEI